MGVKGLNVVIEHHTMSNHKLKVSTVNVLFTYINIQIPVFLAL